MQVTCRPIGKGEPIVYTLVDASTEKRVKYAIQRAGKTVGRIVRNGDVWDGKARCVDVLFRRWDLEVCFRVTAEAKDAFDREAARARRAKRR